MQIRLIEKFCRLRQPFGAPTAVKTSVLVFSVVRTFRRNAVPPSSWLNSHGIKNPEGQRRQGTYVVRNYFKKVGEAKYERLTFTLPAQSNLPRSLLFTLSKMKMANSNLTCTKFVWLRSYANRLRQSVHQSIQFPYELSASNNSTARVVCHFGYCFQAPYSPNWFPVGQPLTNIPRLSVQSDKFTRPDIAIRDI